MASVRITIEVSGDNATLEALVSALEAQVEDGNLDNDDVTYTIVRFDVDEA